MDKPEACAYVHAMVACALIEMESMKAANSQYPEDQLFNQSHFVALIEKYGIHHNAVLLMLQSS